MMLLESHGHSPKDLAGNGGGNGDEREPEGDETRKIWRDILRYESILRQQTDTKLRQVLTDMIVELKRRIDKPRS
jgi:hypothetical protein